MRTRFTPITPPPTPPDQRVHGVHLDLDGFRITGMTPRRESWGVIWFNTLEGWWDAPGTTGQTNQHMFADGGWNTRAFRTPRVIEVTGQIHGPDRPSVREGIETLMSHIPLDDEKPLVVTEDGLVRHCMVRQAGDPDAKWAKGPTLMAEWNIQLVSADSRKLAGDGTPTSGWKIYGPVGLPSTTGGLTVPHFVPFAIDAETNSGRVELALGGTATPTIIIEFAGPVSTPGIWNVDTGESMRFDISLSRGQTLVVDLLNRSVRLNGVSRRSTMRGQWLQIGPRDVLEFTAGIFTDDARMTVRAQEASI